MPFQYDWFKYAAAVAKVFKYDPGSGLTSPLFLFLFFIMHENVIRKNKYENFVHTTTLHK
jgi:hypothetical protein